MTAKQRAIAEALREFGRKRLFEVPGYFARRGGLARQAEMTKAEMQAEIDRLKDKCDKQAMMLRRLFPERYPDTFFICGEGGDKDANGLPDIVFICPAYGCDFSTVYEKRGVHPER